MNFQILELTLKEKNIHIQYIEARNIELQDNIQSKEKDLIDLECSMSSQTSKTEKSLEISEKTYSKLFNEKNKEIERLNEELRKRTLDLQAVVNQELWQKNKEIEKLQIKYTQLLDSKEKEMIDLKESFTALSTNLNELRNENEEKHNENTNLKIDISDLKLQLQLLREKIGEIGLISDDKLEVEIIISSLDEMKNIQQQLEDVKKEKEILTTKINELEGGVQIYGVSTQEKNLENLREELKTSEDLRLQTTEVCHILRRQLEELAVFLDSLMKQKSVLGFLGSTQNRKLREAIEHSLDLSKTLNLSLSMNPEQSLMQLSNITSLLNCSDVSNMTVTDSNRYSFSIIPEQATLTYQSHLLRVDDDNRDNKSFVVKALEDQVLNLQRELNMKNNELSRYRRESRGGKDPRLSSNGKPRISPNKLKNSITLRSKQPDSESEAWSEPDVNVSKARIGLFQEDEIVGIEEIQSSDSTDESLTHLDLKKSDILNECQVTITKLSKQVQDLQAKLQEKERHLIELQEVKDANNSLEEENNLLLVRVETLENDLKKARSELEIVKACKVEIEKELEAVKDQILELERSKKKLEDSHSHKDKELCDTINKMKIEREQLVNMASEYAFMTETSRQEVIELENKLTQLSMEKAKIEVDLKNEYDENLSRQMEIVEKQFLEKYKESEMKSVEQVNNMTKKITELTENYAENYVKKSEILEKMNEIKALTSELNVLRGSLEDKKKAAELSGLVEKSMKEEINSLQMKVNEVEFALIETRQEKEILKKELGEEIRKNGELQNKHKDIQQELLLLKENYDKDIAMLHGFKSKLELKVSELEFTNADLHNRLVKLQSEMSELSHNNSTPIAGVNLSMHHVSQYSRQISNNSQLSQSYVSEDDVKTRGVFSIVVPQKSLDSERIESNASPDLGIESDQGRFSSLEVQAKATSRPLQKTIEIAESMNNLLDGDNGSAQESTCGKLS